ncbi:hypothetical protein B0H17DRAFT_922042, partial [Mycena rosella]
RLLVSVVWHLIWNLHVNRVIKNPDSSLTVADIHKHWLSNINAALRRDRILTDKIKFGPLALKKQLLLNTWSGLLLDEDSVPDWTYTAGLDLHRGVLVGMGPTTNRNGIG